MASAVNQPPMQATEQDLKRRLIELGLLKEIPSGPLSARARQEHEPIHVDGVPVSEFILQDRR